MAKNHSKTTPVVEAPVTEAPVEETTVTESPVVEETVTEAPVAPPVPETPPVVVEETVEEAVELSEFEKEIAKVLASKDNKLTIVISALTSYVKKMAPGQQINFKEGAMLQYGLWKTISAISENYDGQSFKAAWGILLAFFNEHAKGVFGPRYAFRFSEDWSYNPDELEALQRIIDLCMLTANPSTRKSVLTQVNFTKVLSKGFSEAARNKIVSYYR